VDATATATAAALARRTLAIRTRRGITRRRRGGHDGRRGRGGHDGRRGRGGHGNTGGHRSGRCGHAIARARRARLARATFAAPFALAAAWTLRATATLAAATATTGIVGGALLARLAEDLADALALL